MVWSFRAVIRVEPVSGVLALPSEHCAVTQQSGAPGSRPASPSSQHPISGSQSQKSSVDGEGSALPPQLVVGFVC